MLNGNIRVQHLLLIHVLNHSKDFQYLADMCRRTFVVLVVPCQCRLGGSRGRCSHPIEPRYRSQRIKEPCAEFGKLEEKEGSKTCEPCDGARDRARQELRRTAEQPVTDEEVAPFHCPIRLGNRHIINGYTGSIELVDEDERAPGLLCAKCRTFNEQGIPAWGSVGSSSGGGPGMSPKKAGKQPRKDISRNSDRAKGYYTSSSARHLYVGPSGSGSSQRSRNIKAEMRDLEVGTRKRAPLALEDFTRRKLAEVPAFDPAIVDDRNPNKARFGRGGKRGPISLLSTPAAPSSPLPGLSYPAPPSKPLEAGLKAVRADEGAPRERRGWLSSKTGIRKKMSKNSYHPWKGGGNMGSRGTGR
ncbi:hypothetical protein EJ03DRAFT_211546 [Teratosphaeria nubilosa]|uniref:Uncharacterized protein n=1 Tax=Teratosphaeria nubilosa TaxID=161662 RepID=A0A6G1LGF6_9PEZI|nr:hypothetical protein EJ03DRAFT_211546 [Teratosphaeria nubilosa]